MHELTDKELLELAAKAAGYSDYAGGLVREQFSDSWVEWSPLTDDGDALRLAVKLNLIQKHSFLDALGEENDVCNGDYYAATRRAIVRAAAEIGKAMP